MSVELVRATTSDGLRLDGALYLPGDDTDPKYAVDAAVYVHGTGSNFYGSTLAETLTTQLVAAGVAMLVVNTRGHDLVSTAAFADGPRLGGAAYETVSDCALDVAAWVELLERRGLRRVVLVGHSLGAVKAVYAVVRGGLAGVAGVVAISPPRLHHAAFRDGPEGAAFVADYERSAALVEAGRGEELLEIRFPLPYLVSARGYVDKYGPDSTYDIVELASALEGPALFLYGSVETATNVAFRGVPEMLEAGGSSKRAQVSTIAGADHFYAGCRRELLARIRSWLKREFAA